MEPLGRSTSDSPSQLKSPIHMRNSQGNHNSASAPSPNLNFANEDRPNTSQCIYVLHDQPNESSNTLASSGSQLFTQCLATNVVEPSSEPILHPMDFYSTAPLFHQNLKLAPTQSGIFSQNNLDALHSLFEMKKEPKNIGDRSSILLGSLDPILTPIDDDSLGSTSRQYRDLAFVESSLTTMENSPFSELEDESTRKYREKRERNNLAARKHRKNRTQREHEKSLRAEALVAECRELREILNTNLEYIKNLEREVQAHKQRLDNKENTVGCVNAEYPATMRASSPQYESLRPEYLL